MTLLAYVFLKLRTLKDVVRKMSKKSRLRGSLKRTHGKRSQTLININGSTLIFEMHLSQQQKTFSQFFCAFFKSTTNFEHFQKKMTLIAYVSPKLQTPKYVVRKMFKKSRLRGPINRQHGKLAQTLTQSHWQHLYHIH